MLWLSTWMIHHANHVRASRDGLKVGGHQASCASMVTLMTALYFDVLRPADRVAVKPHGSPVFHAIQYLLGNQTRDQLERFRAFGGRPVLSLSHQGQGRRGHLDRVGRDGGRDDELRSPSPSGSCGRAGLAPADARRRGG